MCVKQSSAESLQHLIPVIKTDLTQKMYKNTKNLTSFFTSIRGSLTNTFKMFYKLIQYIFT